MALSYNQLLSKLPPYCKRRNIDFTPYSGGKKFVVKFVIEGKDDLFLTITHASHLPQTDKFTLYLSQNGFSADGKYFFNKSFYTLREVTHVIKAIDENGIDFSSLQNDKK